MSRYISIDDLQAYCDNQSNHSITPNEFQRMDSICIVRCKDCKMRKNNICHNPNTFGAIVTDMYFCADGEAKDGENK